METILEMKKRSPLENKERKQYKKLDKINSNKPEKPPIEERVLTFVRKNKLKVFLSFLIPSVLTIIILLIVQFSAGTIIFFIAGHIGATILFQIESLNEKSPIWCPTFLEEPFALTLTCYLIPYIALIVRIFI